MKKIYILLLLVCPSFIFAQTKYSDFEKKYSRKSFDTLIPKIPYENFKIIYEEVFTTDSSETKQSLYVKLRTWFLEKFNTSTSVIQVDNPAEGMMLGKGSYKFEKANGLNVHEGWVTFILNVVVKDGKFKYRLYDFNYTGMNKSMLASPNERGGKEVRDFNEAMQDYVEGKRLNYNRKFLEDLVVLHDYITTTMKASVKEKLITDF